MVMVSKPKNQIWAPKKAIKAHLGPKIEILKFKLDEKLEIDHHFHVKFCDELNEDGLETQKPRYAVQ